MVRSTWVRAATAVVGAALGMMADACGGTDGSVAITPRSTATTGEGGASGTTTSSSHGGAGGGTTSSHGGAGGTSGACAPGAFRCTGDDLERCGDGASGFIKVVTCPVAGHCDASGGQCDVCTPKEAACSDATTLKTCSDDGQLLTPVTCGGDRPFCTSTPTGDACVECTTANDCTSLGSDCAVAACSAQGACGTQPIAAGTACGAPGAGGTCDGAGQCTYCKPGDAKCDGSVPSNCDANGQWQMQPACAGAAPVCDQGACVACLADGDCPAAVNECLVPSCSGKKTCEPSPKAAGVPCANGAGTCDGAGQCNVCQPGSKVCNGDQLLVCNAQGKYEAPITCSGKTPKCDPQSPKCVECYDASQCPKGANDCLSATCTSNLCGFAKAAIGSACSDGTCDAQGACVPPPGQGQLLWLSSDVGIKDAQNVSAWADRSPAVNDASQISAAARPLIIASALNGKPVVRFDGATDCMNLPPGFSNFTQGVSEFIVVRVTSLSGYGRMLQLATGPCDDMLLLERNGGTPDLLHCSLNGHDCNCAGGIVIASAVVALAQPALFEMVEAANGTPTLFKNGAVLSTGKVPVPVTVSRTSNALGCAATAGIPKDHFFKGDMAEVMLYARAVSDAERMSIETYLKAKWGI